MTAVVGNVVGTVVDSLAIVWLLLLLLVVVFALFVCDKAAAEADRAAAEAEDYARRNEDGGEDTPDPPSLRPIQIPEEGDGELDDMVRYVLVSVCCSAFVVLTAMGRGAGG